RATAALSQKQVHVPWPSWSSVSLLELLRQAYDLDVRGPILDRQQRHARLKIEAARTCGTRIHDHPSLLIAKHQGFMSVAVDENVSRIARQQPLRSRLAQLVAVADMKQEPFDRQRALARQHRIKAIVDIPRHGFDWRNRAQLLEDVARSDVAGVNDQ